MGGVFLGAKIGPEGYYCDEDGNALPVSASDLERFMYCPLSWQLAKEGTSGIGEAIEEGVEKHKEIHKDMSEMMRVLKEAPSSVDEGMLFREAAKIKISDTLMQGLFEKANNSSSKIRW